MRRAALLLAALLLSGCGRSLHTAIALADTAELSLQDERPDALDESSPGWGALALVPLVPYATTTHRHFLERSFAPGLRERLTDSNLFRVVHGPDAPDRLRHEAEWHLEVTLTELQDRRTTTTWLLGPAGAALWLFAIPAEMVATDAALRVAWRQRSGAIAPFETQGRAEVLTPYVVYVDARARVPERATRALGRALDQALRAGLRHLREVGAR